MNLPEIIQFLSERAAIHYEENTHPEPFAAFAAQMITKTTAAQLDAHAANDATFVAGISSLNNLAKFSVKQTNTLSHLDSMMQNYRFQKTPLSEIEQSIVSKSNALVSQIDATSFETHAYEWFRLAYPLESSLQAHLALQAACSIYMHAYASARTAYTYASALAERYAKQERHNIFKQAMIERLTMDLLSEPVQPGFFIEMMSSKAVCGLAIILLVAGIAAVALGVCALAIAPVGAALLTYLAISGAALTTIGAATATSGASLLVGRFFIEKKWQKDNASSARAVREINQLEETLSIPLESSRI